jgi:hypothetical protein
MTNFMLLLTGHRTLLIGLIAIALWFGAYYKYFSRYLRPYYNRTKPHSWSVDMVNKRALRQGKPEAS